MGSLSSPSYDVQFLSKPSASSLPRRRPLIFTVLAFPLLLSLYPFYHLYSPSAPLLSPSQISRFHSDLSKCASISHAPYWELEAAKIAEKRTKNHRFSIPSLPREPTLANDVDTKPASLVILRNATVFDGEKWIDGFVDIVAKEGIITVVTSSGSGAALDSLKEGAKVEVLDLSGKYVTPGLIDMHSHSTLDSFPSLRGTEEVNEMTNPLTSWVRTIDGINPHDPAVGIIASGGITTSLILPGSANIIGGEAYVIKNRYVKSNTVKDMLVEPEGSPNRKRWMKMACGENPKSVYPEQTKTRMGLAHSLRSHFAAAKELLIAQDAWCSQATAAATSGNTKAMHSLAAAGLPEKLDLESMVAILRGEIRVNIHCYETMDMEAMIRHSKEFGWRIEAFHHAHDAYRIPELLKSLDYNITIAMFAEMALYKKEAYQGSFWAGKILADAGIPVAYKSDHPVTNAKYLMYQAALAHSFKLPEDLALASVTSTPAKALGLSDRIGYLRDGYDADITIWNSHPLAIGATPIQVYIDGFPLLNKKEAEETLPSGLLEAESKPQIRTEQSAQSADRICKTSQNSDEIVVIEGIAKSFLVNAPHPENTQLTLVLRSNKILCFSTPSSCSKILSTAASPIRKITLNDGYLLPGLTAVSTALGLSEIEQEEKTQDGAVASSSSASGEPVYAKYGLKFGSKTLRRAVGAGITNVVTAPMHNGGLIRGVSVGFKAGAENVLEDGAVFKDDIAVHFVVGQDGKSDANPTISSQIQALRELLFTSVEKNETVYSRAAKGDIPVVVHTNNEADIAQIIKIKRDLPRVDFVLSGGAEAWRVADELAAVNMSVILSPWRCVPEEWEYRRCLTGPPSTKSIVQILYAAGVKFSIAEPEDDLVRNLPWEASWAAKYIGFPTKDEEEAFAVNLISKNLKEILRIEEAEAQEFVLWEGNPLRDGARVVLVVDGKDGEQKVKECWPKIE